MPRLFLACVLVLITDPEGFCAEIRKAGFGETNAAVTILIGRPTRIKVDPGSVDLMRMCRSKRVYGCTVFAEERLSCGCQRNGTAWQMRATATFTPVMVLTDLWWDQHEAKHVEHVRGMLENYLRGLTTRRHRSEVDCQKAAAAAETGFLTRMNRFRSRSNDFLH